MKRFETILIGAAIIAVSSALAWGQVDARVNQGNVLDANPGVGTGGVNTEVAPTNAMDTQLVVGNQVTGLAGFRGNVPYYQGNQFRGNLPSQMLESFNARSVSLYQAQTGVGLSQTAGYFGRQQTIVGLRGIEAGLNAPGTTTPLQSAVPVQTINEFRNDALQRYQTVYVQRPAGQLLSDNPIQGPMTNVIVLGQSQGDGDVFGGEDIAFQPGADALLAMPWEKNRQELMDEFLDMREDLGAGTQLDTDTQLREGLGEGMKTSSPAETPEGVMTEDEPGEGESVAYKATVGKDAYFDLTVAMHMQSGADPSVNPVMAGYVREYQKSIDKSCVYYDAVNKLYVIRSLAGTSTLEFNKVMSQAQILAFRERYYLANMKFNAAALLSTHNPMPSLGSCISMFTAGEPIHAAGSLKMAMMTFPPIMETRLDISQIVSKDDFTAQLSALKTMLEESDSPEPSLLMLATYMSLTNGDTAAAKEYAGTLSRVAGNDKLLSTYAKFVLTGERPEADDE
jgi:hypothetical protein